MAPGFAAEFLLFKFVRALNIAAKVQVMHADGVVLATPLHLSTPLFRLCAYVSS